MPLHRHAHRVLGILTVWTAFAVAQTEPAKPAENQNRAAITALVPLVEREEAELAELRKKLPKLTTAEEKAETEEAIGKSRTRIRELRQNIRSLATGVSEEEWTGVSIEQRTLNQEFQDIITPILGEIRASTAGQREISDLREEISRWKKRLALTDQALARLSQFNDVEKAKGADELASVKQLWTDRHSEATGELKALRARLADRERREGGIISSLSRAITKFWKSRGLNLLLAIGSFALTIFAGNQMRTWFQKHNPLTKERNSKVSARLLELTAGVFVALTACVVFLLVLYLRGDWLLLSISFVVLVAAALASRNLLVPYAEQVRTLLNLGTVREGERMIYHGVPWRLDSLGVYCHFSNPQLEGGTLRLHVRELSTLHSRPNAAKETWFPTDVDDWVLLGDGTFGKIDHQTPEVVTVLHLGGSRRSYPTAEFLDLAPENMSHGYRIISRFGIDYRHQSIAIDKVPPALVQSIDRFVTEVIPRDHIHSLKVEFAEANTSSLDFEILADFTGDAARFRNTLIRSIQAACVAACNENGWTIPFPQLTLHQAANTPTS